ncbi:unnamed protein product [Sphagnum jensenii]|uniref:Uncharacterized protein n=1 Tax=Sphagnum jensenii TaxID=128206 RepID=A0ABP0W3W7_9BRYO
MAGTSGGGFGSRGGDNNEERTLEKKRRKDERDAIRKEKLDLKKKEEERKKLPLITLAEEGIPTELAYTGAKSTIRHIVSTNFARGVEWGTLSKAEQKRVINQLKEIIEQLAKAKKARELGRSDRDLKALEVKLAECQSVVDEVGDPPLKFLKAVERVKLVPPTTHRLGQGGIPGLKAAFYKRYKRKITAAEMTMGQEHGKEHLFEHVDALLGESESSQGSSDEEERGPSTTPSATISSGPCSITSRNASFVGGKDKEDREEEEEEEGQGDNDEREEDEQPPPPPENTRKKHSRKKSKRGRKSR